MHGALRIINIPGPENREDKLTEVTTDNPDQRNVVLTWAIRRQICTANSVEFLALGQVNNATWGCVCINSENHFLIPKWILKLDAYYSYG